ncbi:MAG: ATP-grasp domain-containing protein [Spirochaetes bacterium]|nr:ATP-grasp domain-containing protein [Spirochaetota bacterium]
MRTIGLTYDLKDDYLAAGFSTEEAAEFDSPQTIQALEDTIRSLGFQVDRIGNLRVLMRRLLAGDRWDLVFNIAEGARGPGRESEVPCLLEAFRIPYTFSDPMVLALCLHKGMTKHVIRDNGIPTSDFIVLQQAKEVEKVRLPFPLFVKPVAEGTGKGVSTHSKVESAETLRRTVTQLLEKFQQPVLVERFLPGKEYTVGIIGTGSEAEVIGGMEIRYGSSAEGEIYSYSNKAQYEGRISYHPIEGPAKEKVYQIALDAYRVLCCRDGGRVDIREDERGEPQFMEINPLPGLHPVDSDLPILARLHGMPYTRLIERILTSACKRNGL